MAVELFAVSDDGFAGPAVDGETVSAAVLEELNGLLFQNAMLGVDHLPLL